MAKNKGIYIERDTLINRIEDICSEKWNDFSVSKLYKVGNTNRCDIEVQGKKASLNFFFKSDGTTTIQVTGINTEISQLIKDNLETTVKYKANVESRTCSFKKVPPEWANKLIGYFRENNNVTIQTEEIRTLPKHIKYVLSSKYCDKLIINQYENGTLVLQGKPAYIYAEAINFLSYCNEITVEDIVESVSDINKVSINTDEVCNELKMLLKNSYDKIDPVILKLLSPSIALRKVSIDLDDYSCFAFPALRALEGYIKWLLGNKGVKVGNTFCGVFSGYNLMQDAVTKISNKNYILEVERVFKYFKDNRHIHFHTEQILIGTTLIEKRNEADAIINEVIELIDSSYKNIVS